MKKNLERFRNLTYNTVILNPLGTKVTYRMIKRTKKIKTFFGESVLREDQIARYLHTQAIVK